MKRLLGSIPTFALSVPVLQVRLQSTALLHVPSVSGVHPWLAVIHPLFLFASLKLCT